MTPQDKGALKRTQARVNDYQKVFNSSEGKRVLFDLMLAHHVCHSTMGNDHNSHTMAYREGERNVVLRIMATMKLDAERIHKILQEADKHAEHLQDL